MENRQLDDEHNDQLPFIFHLGSLTGTQVIDLIKSRNVITPKSPKTNQTFRGSNCSYIALIPKAFLWQCPLSRTWIQHMASKSFNLFNLKSGVCALLVITGLMVSRDTISAEYTHFITFEDRPWSQTYPIIYPWSGTNRDTVEHADERAAFFSLNNICTLSTDWVQNGIYSALCNSAADGIKARRMVELVGNTSNGISRKLQNNKEYWLGFTLNNMEPLLETNWELYYQLHNNAAPPAGWGSTSNPMVAIERDTDDFYKVLYRYNTDDGQLVTRDARLGAVTVGSPTSFIIHVKLSNPSSEGFIEIWQKNAVDNSYIRYMSATNIRIGYYRLDPANGPTVSLGIYNGPSGAIDRTVYIDDIFVSDDLKFTIEPAIPDGDINNDGVVNAADILIASRILSNQINMTAEQMSHADVAPLINGQPSPNGLFNIGDIVVLQRKVLGLINF